MKLRTVLFAAVLALGLVAFAGPVAPVASAGHEPCTDKFPGHCEIVRLVCPVRYGWFHCYPI